MRQIIFTILFITASILVFAQKNGSIKGVVFDTSAKQPVPGATITVLQKKDSSLVSFSMTDNAGRFEITGIPEGEYRLLITHVNYHNNHRYFKIDDSNKDLELGTLAMIDLATVLSEVVVVAEAPPVTLVGDTIQYNAGSFKTQPNSNVEDLLKKLPGVKVEKDGTVKAQGETVKKVLVDGKEFFGNDPKIATKNLPADAIDKVQVYDKMSDQAQLTGFEDGNSEKTINLKLKKDKKKGKFGKVAVGGGNDGRYQGRFNVNSFKGARQMSAIGMGNNTNAEGFSFMDVLNFTGAMNQLKNGGGNINISIGADDPLAGLLGVNNSGINTSWGGGINYNNIIGTKTDFQSNYFFSRYNPNRQSQVRQQYFSGNVREQESYVDNLNNNHRFNFSADYQIDSFHSIKFSPGFSYQKTNNESLSDYSTRSGQGVLINEGNTSNLSTGEGYSMSSNLLFRKKFHRKGRTFSLNLLTNLNNSDGAGRLQSIVGFYDQAGSLIERDSTNQVSNSSADLKGYNVRAVYTEPIFKRSLLEFSAGKSYGKNNSSKTTYDYNGNNDKFDLLNNELSNDFENSNGYTTTGFRLRKQTKKYNYAAGVVWQHSEMEGKVVNGNKDSVIGKSFNNLLPNARVQYYFSRYKNITLTYGTNINQPGATQLQPVPDNTNPLYVKLGNPDLKQEFSHSIRLNASFVNPFKNRNLFANINFQQTQNKIVNYDKFNNFGVDSVMPVNVNGVYNVNSYISWGFPVRFIKGSFEISSRIGYNKGKQLITDISTPFAENTIKTFTAGPEARIDINATEELTLAFTAGLQYSKTNYSISSARNAKYLNHDYSVDVNWQLPKKFYFNTEFNYMINGQHAPGFNDKIALWNASLSKQVLPFNRGEVKLSVRDIMNENIGINRSTNQNYIEDSRVNSLRRFFLVSFTYNLSKTGLTNNGGGNRVIMR